MFWNWDVEIIYIAIYYRDNAVWISYENFIFHYLVFYWNKVTFRNAQTFCYLVYYYFITFLIPKYFYWCLDNVRFYFNFQWGTCMLKWNEHFMFRSRLLVHYGCSRVYKETNTGKRKCYFPCKMYDIISRNVRFVLNCPRKF